MTAPLLIQIRKEGRALLPWWSGMMAVSAAAVIWGQHLYSKPDGSYLPVFRDEQSMWAILVCAAATLAIAAVSMGLELTHGTLAGLLVLPVSRLRILWIKLGVLAASLGLLAVLVNVLFDTRYLPLAARPLVMWGPLMVSIGLVPLLTLLTRRALGGAVFAVVVPGALFLIATLLYPAKDDPAVWNITWQATLIVSVLGLCALPTVFGRLQVAGDGPIPAPAWSRAIAINSSIGSRRRHWVWLSIRKELRLQSLTLTVSGLYGVVCIAVAFVRHRNPQYSGPTFEALSNLFGVFIPIIAGAFASAEERQLGTLASQLLAPKATWKPWTIKVLVTMALTLGLGFGLPSIMGGVTHQPSGFRVHEELIVASIALVSVSMWVSSLSTSSLWALLATFPAVAVAMFVGGAVLEPVERALRQQFAVNPRLITTHGVQLLRAFEQYLHYLSVALALGAPLLVLVFAGRNHRSLRRSWRSAGRQILWILIYCVLATLILRALSIIARNTLGRS